MKKILIAGGTGFIGNMLVPFLENKGYSASLLTREAGKANGQNNYYYWDPEKSEIDIQAFEDVQILINLTGANIAKGRWTNERKTQLAQSRAGVLNFLFERIKTEAFPVKYLISSSAVGFYGAKTVEHIFEETDPAGEDFLARICMEWETAALRFQELGTQTLILRKGVVLGKDAGAYAKMAPMAKMGLNPAMGNGKQWFPWIGIRDLLRIYDFFLMRKNLSGIYNVVAPESVTLNDFSKTLLASFGKRKWTPNLPGFILKSILGEMAITLLNGSRVNCDKLKQAGFNFDFGTLAPCLNDLAKTN